MWWICKTCKKQRKGCNMLDYAGVENCYEPNLRSVLKALFRHRKRS